MFNLTVQDTHTYYVLAGNTPVLVHNDSAPVPPIIQNAIDAYNDGQLSQRMTGPRDARVPDVFRGDTGPIGAVGPTGGARGAGHNYDRISTYKPSC